MITLACRVESVNLMNVYEWRQDRYGKDYYENSPVDSPTGPSTGSDRVARGGGWNNGPRNCRSANRYGDEPGSRYGRNCGLGFRVALVPAE